MFNVQLGNVSEDDSYHVSESSIVKSYSIRVVSCVTRFRWGVFGTGAISAKFVAGLAAARDMEVGFIASRSLEKAQRFAAGVGGGRAIEGYAEAIAAGGVDAVYVATPPSEHAAHAVLCIEAGFPVLVEKPFALSAAEAVRVADAARSHSVFTMEAMWTRFLPAAQAMRDLVLKRSVGEVRLVTGNFGTSQAPELRNSMFDRQLGGGAISHLGGYPLSLAQWLFGSHRELQALGKIGATGVDEEVAFSLRYDDGVIGSFLVSIRAWGPDHFHLLGAEGMISFRGSIVRPNGLDISREKPRFPEEAQFGLRARLRQSSLSHQIAQRLGRSSREPTSRLAFRYAGNGYNYEADEVRNCVERGAIESEVMPLRDSIAVAEAADSIRRAVHGR